MPLNEIKIETIKNENFLQENDVMYIKLKFMYILNVATLLMRKSLLQSFQNKFVLQLNRARITDYLVRSAGGSEFITENSDHFFPL